MTLTAQQYQRLAFVRHLYLRATEDAVRPDPLAPTALLWLHDAVELFCVLVVEHANASLRPRANFDDYWQVLRDVGVDLGSQQPMRRLNNARVSLKHHGIAPTRADVEGYVTASREFFERNARSVFDVDWNTVSMVDLVTLEPTATLLRRATTLGETGEYVDALVQCRGAYVELLATYRERRWGRYGRSPFSVDVSYLSLSDDSMLASEVESFADEVHTALEVVDETLEAVVLGLDVERLVDVRRNWPRARVVDGEYRRPDVLDRYRTYDREAVDQSIEFIIECALRLQRRLP